MDYRNFSTTTQYSEDHFPKYMHVSADFTITSLSGNIRTFIFLLWRTFRVIDCHLASICL